MKAVITFLLAVLAYAAAGQQLISGQVIDRATRQPVAFALVQGFAAAEKEVTDNTGYFSIRINTDTADLLISSIGYQQQRQRGAAGSRITVELSSGIVNMKELTLIAGNAHTATTAISKIDLNLRPVKSSQELLRNVPGLFIAQHQGGGKAEQFFLRGFDIDHGTDISISVDGIPVNMVSHAHGQGYADLHFVIPELVKNIDYGKGPYYAERGNLNTAGYAALETVNKLDRNVLQAERGMFNTTRGLALLQVLNKPMQDAYLAGEILYSDGPFQKAQQFNRANVQGRYNLRLNEKHQLRFTASLLNSRWLASGQVPQRAIDAGLIDRFGEISGESGYTGRINTSLSSTHRFANNATLENLLYYTRYHFNLYSDFTFFLNDPVNGDQIRQREKRDLWGGQTKYTIKQQAGNSRFTTTLGAGLRQDRTYGSELSQTKDKTILLNRLQQGNISETNGWLWAEEKLAKGRWLLTAGIRGDYFSFGYADMLTGNNQQQRKGILSPKLGLQYTASKQLQLYAKAGQGFHSNDTRVVLSREATKILPAATGVDLGIVWKPVPQLLVNAAAWYLHSQQEFVYVGDEGIVEPGGSSRRRGIDLSLRYQLGKHWFADVNLNQATARAIGAEKGNDFIPLAPLLTSTGGIGYQAKQGLNGSLRYRYIKNRPADETGSITAKGYFLADLSLSYTRQRYELGIVAENLLNTRWNEAQFATTSRLQNEPNPVTELHFTPGVPRFVKLKLAFFF